MSKMTTETFAIRFLERDKIWWANENIVGFGIGVTPMRVWTLNKDERHDFTTHEQAFDAIENWHRCVSFPKTMSPWEEAICMEVNESSRWNSFSTALNEWMIIQIIRLVTPTDATQEFIRRGYGEPIPVRSRT